eukprot:scaffold83397_cov57-Phaeocystis_antarctica.AAC.3
MHATTEHATTPFRGGAHHTAHPDARPVLLLVLRAGPAGGAATRRGGRCRRSVSGSSILNKRLDRPLHALDGRLLLARALGSFGWRRRRLRKRVRGLRLGIRGIFLLGGLRCGLAIGRCRLASRGRGGGGASGGRGGGGRGALIEGVEHLA